MKNLIRRVWAALVAHAARARKVVAELTGHLAAAAVTEEALAGHLYRALAAALLLTAVLVLRR